MAQACSKTYNADIGIGVTGSMGNVDPANAAASVPGQVWVAFCINGEVFEYYLELEPQPTRFEYKMAVAKEIIDIAKDEQKTQIEKEHIFVAFQNILI